MHQKVFFDEFDYWAGTFALVVMAFAECILFSWVFGAKRGFEEMHRGAELMIPRIYYYIIKYVTPVFLGLILLGYIFQPAAGWGEYAHAIASGEPAPAWEWSGSGMIGKLLFNDVVINPNDPPETQEFWRKVKVVRVIDRLVLVGVFVGFCVLVKIAWKKRHARGEVLP